MEEEDVTWFVKDVITWGIEEDGQASGVEEAGTLTEASGSSDLVVVVAWRSRTLETERAEFWGMRRHGAHLREWGIRVEGWEA